MAETTTDLPAGSQAPDLDFAAAFWTGERPIHAATLRVPVTVIPLASEGGDTSRISGMGRSLESSVGKVAHRPGREGHPFAVGDIGILPPREGRSEGRLSRAMTHEPGIDVGEHGGRQAMGAWIGLEGHAEPACPERGDVAAGFVERRPVVPGPVHGQEREGRDTP